MANPRTTMAVLTAAMLTLVAACRQHDEAPPASAPPTATAVAPPKAADVSAARLAAADPDQWLTPGRDANGTYYSPLKDIDAGNVAQLGFAWDYRLGTRRGQEATPLVIDGIMYATSNFGRVYALDAATGRELWTYDPQIDGRWARYACCDAVNRGLAAFEGTLYVGATRRLAARARRAHRPAGLEGRHAGRSRSSTSPIPSPARRSLRAIWSSIGNGGADFAGTRGYVSAYDLKSGQLRWRFYTVPRDPAQGPQDQPHLTAALKTWDPRHPWEAGTGGTVWDGMAYDPALNLVYIGTANAAPYNMQARWPPRAAMSSTRPRSSRSMRTTAPLAWYYQTTPGDRWDFDSTQKLVLADVDLEGQRRQRDHAGRKNGFYYVLDRAQRRS